MHVVGNIQKRFFQRFITNYIKMFLKIERDKEYGEFR